jgi:predicted nucleic acid-binding protein
MRYWDSSALVPLLVQEPETARRAKQLRVDAVVATWWGTRVECASALNRLARDGAMTDAQLKESLGALGELADGWVEVLPSDRVRFRALRLLRVHPLRAADALQLSACLDVCERAPAEMQFVSGDDRLCEAADKEGLSVVR